MSHSPWMAMRSLTRDGEVVKKKLAPGTIPRIAQFARPYKRQISLFLVLVVLDAMLVVALPLLFKVIIDEGVLKDDKGVVVAVALVVAGIAVFDALLTLSSGCCPPRWVRASSTTCGPRSSATCSGCPSRSSRARRPALSSAGSTPT